MKQALLLTILSALLLISCQQEPSPMPSASPTPNISYINGPFTPPDGKTLFIIGQDVESVEGYIDEVGPMPGGFTGYTSLDRLEGITRRTDYGSGPHHLDYLAETYPQSTIALGLYLVGYLPAIPVGQADRKIDLLLSNLEGYNRPVYLRFGYEFDGAWNHYPPEEYVAAWIYFREKMQARGVENVAMVWQSATYCGGTYLNEPISAWYPGDEHVDWIGLSYFTQSDCDFSPLFELLAFARAHDKPVMIAESTSQRYDTRELTYSDDGHTYDARAAAEIFNEWFVPYFDLISQNADVIRAVAYINTRWDDQAMWGPPYTSGYWGDTRVQANEEILEKWQAEMQKEIWLHSQDDLFSILNHNGVKE